MAAAAAVAAALARQDDHHHAPAALAFETSAKREEEDDFYQAANQNTAIHNRFLADRDQEREQAKKQRSIVERILRLFGWHPKRAPNAGGDPFIRAFIEKRERANRGIIDPRKSRFVNNWDQVILLLLLFTTLVTPYEVVFLPSTTNITALFVINRIVDAGFIYDMKVQFNLAFQTSMLKGGAWVLERRRIRAKYLSFWFWIDLLSVFPFWLITFFVTTDESSGSGGVNLQVFRIIRLMRLVKITRILKASRIFKRLETSMSVTYAALGMAKLLIYLFTWSHLQSCLWGLIPQLLDEEHSWIDALQATQEAPLSPWDTYVAGLYFSIMTVTSIGYGEMLPVTTNERWICSILMLASSTVWCYVMGQACSIAATMDPSSIEFQANMDALNQFMHDRGLPKTLKVELRKYFHSARQLMRASQDTHVIAMMSPLMQSTVALQANAVWLDKIWYLRSDWYKGDAEMSHASFVATVAQKLEASAYVTQERVAGGLMCIVSRGLAIKRWRFMSAGKVWGEDIILDDPRLVDYSEAVAMTYLEVYTLDRPSLDAATRQFPDCANRIRKAARRMMIQRGIVSAMRKAANLPPPKSFVMPRGPRMHALPTVSVEEKIDILIGSSNVASQKLRDAEAVKSLNIEELALADGEDGAEAEAAAGGGAVEAAASGAAATPGAATPASVGRVPSDPSSGYITSSGAAKAVVASTSPSPSLAAVPAISERDSDAASAAQTLERLAAMHADCVAMQAAMGAELGRLAASLAKGRKLTHATPPERRHPSPPKRAMAPVASPVFSLPGLTAREDDGVHASPNSPPLGLAQIREDGGPTPDDWGSSARKFLPSWALSPPVVGPPGAAQDSMSA